MGDAQSLRQVAALSGSPAAYMQEQNLVALAQGPLLPEGFATVAGDVELAGSGLLAHFHPMDELLPFLCGQPRRVQNLVDALSKGIEAFKPALQLTHVPALYRRLFGIKGRNGIKEGMAGCQQITETARQRMPGVNQHIEQGNVPQLMDRLGNGIGKPCVRLLHFGLAECIHLLREILQRRVCPIP